MIAKCYDPTQFPEHQVYGPSKDAYGTELKSREAKANRKLHEFHSFTVPSFHDEYHYVGSQMIQKNAILQQFIDHLSINNLSPTRGIDCDCLKHETFQSIPQCHELGVYHHDIGMLNIFFISNRATICDWENATFADHPSEEHVVWNGAV